jgi:hypothetical protein
MQLYGRITHKSSEVPFVTITKEEDQLIWSLNPTRNYELKFGYKALAQEDREDPQVWWWKKLWKFKFPTKEKIFMWLLLNNKSLTWDILQKRSFEGPEDVAYVRQSLKQTLI